VAVDPIAEVVARQAVVDQSPGIRTLGPTTGKRPDMKPDGTHLSLYDRRIKRVVDVLREDLESAVRRRPGGHP
jgi:hypothetical protein